MIGIILCLMLAIVLAAMVIFCEEVYQLDADIVGTVLADANFLTLGSGEPSERTWKGRSFGYPAITAALGVEALAAGLKDAGGDAYLELTSMRGPYDANFDRWRIPIEFWSHIGDVTAGDLQPPGFSSVDEAFNRHSMNMKWTNGSDLVDGTVSKLFGSGTDLYIALALYMQVGKSPSPHTGRNTIVTYDKGGDVTTVAWTVMENAKQNAIGELRKDRRYRLLWGSFTPEATLDKEALMCRVTVPDYPSLLIPGMGSIYAKKGMGRRVWFMDDSIYLNGDAIHKVESLVGAACQPLAHLCWEDVGPKRVA